MRDKEKNLEHRIVQIDPSACESSLAEAVTALGEMYRNQALIVFVHARRIYRSERLPKMHPDDRILRRIYENRMNEYATEAVREWIKIKQSEGDGGYQT